MSLSFCLFTFGFLVEATSLFHLFHLCHPSTNHCISRYCCHTIHIGHMSQLPYRGQRRVQSELRECSTPPPEQQPVSAPSTSSAHRSSHRSHSLESKLLERLCESSDMNAQICGRLECILTNFEAHVNDCTA